MKTKMDRFFLEETCPFAKSRKVKWKNVRLAGFVVTGLVVIGLILFTPNPEIQNGAQQSGISSRETRRTEPPQSDPRQIHDDPFTQEARALKASAPPRQYSASQLVRRGDGGNSGDKLPMGSTFAVKLVNSVLSSDSNSPLIAEIIEDVVWKGSVLIPTGTRAIGQGALDGNTERLQARFQTLVYPEGDQHPIQALALLGDGSSGITGDFHSRAFKKQAGRFFGNFVGGLAQGLKDKEGRGQSGIASEPGSLKNGLLNGVASSSFDQAKSFADSTDKLPPHLEVPSGTVFLLYLEKEYAP